MVYSNSNKNNNSSSSSNTIIQIGAGRIDDFIQVGRRIKIRTLLIKKKERKRIKEGKRKKKINSREIVDVRCFAFYAIVFCYICLSSVTTGMTMLCTCTCISRMFLLLFMLHAEIYISLFKILRRRCLHVKIQSMSI